MSRIARFLSLMLLLSAAAPALATETASTAASSAKAVFAGGCFWCMEPPYDKLDGVIATTSGYAGGRIANPTYEQVSAGGTGHIEVIQVEYDPRKISYAQLLEVYWRNVDPFAVNRQFCDQGAHYRSAVFVANAEERAAVESSKAALEQRFGKPILTEILAAATFYPAEEYHQDYYLKNPLRYKYYRWSCGRDQRLRDIWGEEVPEPKRPE